MNKRWMTRSLIALCALAAVPAMAQEKKPADTPPVQKPEKPAPKPAEHPAPVAKPTGPIAVGAEVDGALTLLDLEGKPHALKDQRGKIVMLYFFGTGSANTAGYLDRLKKLQTDYAAKGVQFIAVDANATDVESGAEPYKRVREWATSKGLTGVMIDKDHVLAERLGATSNGQAYVVDAKGMLRYSGGLDDDAKGEHADRAAAYARSALDAVIAGKTPEKATTPVAGGDPIAREAKKAEPKPESKPVAKNPPPKTPPAKTPPKKNGVQR